MLPLVVHQNMVGSSGSHIESVRIRLSNEPTELAESTTIVRLFMFFVTLWTWTCVC